MLAIWSKDLKSENMKLVPSAVAGKLKTFLADTAKLGDSADAFSANVTIELMGYANSPDHSGLDRLRKVVIDGQRPRHERGKRDRSRLGQRVQQLPHDLPGLHQRRAAILPA